MTAPSHNHGNLKTKARDLLKTREQLPIWSKQDEIRKLLAGNDVLVLAGETGSGKSTQVPQFLVDEPWCTRKKVSVRQDSKTVKSLAVGGCIAITQPRRVAATSLARRVASEMGSQLGAASITSEVGYSVRFDHSVSPKTRIKFLTEGMLLQEILRDPWLRQYSAVIVDEAHERSVNVDLICGFLRNIVSGDRHGRGGTSLKIVVMSATLDIDKMKSFFSVPKQLNGSGTSNGTAKPTQVVSCLVEGRQYPVSIIFSKSAVQDYVDGALKKIFEIHHAEPLPGDLLVFMPGQDDIEALEKLVLEYAAGLDPKVPKISVHPLFAALSSGQQQSVFLPAQPRTRKVIIATNIAETSVTVPGVRFVIDSGKHKIKQFRTRLGLDSLLVKPVSQSAALQRTGRAGREAAGKCYRLYLEADFDKLETNAIPEILRTDVTQAVLTMKANGIQDVVGFPFLDPPPREAMEKALLQLLSLGALAEDGSISELGKKMASLPLSPSLSRVLLAAADQQYDCLEDVIDIIACLSVENIFLNLITEEQQELAEESRKELLRREGDHITLLSALRLYIDEKADRRRWCEHRMISHRAMQSVLDVRKQLRSYCIANKLLETPQEPEIIDTARSVAIRKTFLTAFSSNTARLMPDGSYKTVVSNQTVAIHPSSVLFGRKLEAILYHQCIFTNKNYARDVSAVEMQWIADALS